MWVFISCWKSVSGLQKIVRAAVPTVTTTSKFQQRGLSALWSTQLECCKMLIMDDSAKFNGNNLSIFSFCNIGIYRSPQVHDFGKRKMVKGWLRLGNSNTWMRLRKTLLRVNKKSKKPMDVRADTHSGLPHESLTCYTSIHHPQPPQPYFPRYCNIIPIFLIPIYHSKSV